MQKLYLAQNYIGLIKWVNCSWEGLFPVFVGLKSAKGMLAEKVMQRKCSYKNSCQFSMWGFVLLCVL